MWVLDMDSGVKYVKTIKIYFLGFFLCLFSLNLAMAENLEIEASGFLEWDQEGKSYKANGNAIVSQGTRSMKANEIMAFYESEENRDIIRIEAEGDVSFTDSINSGYSEKLTYDLDTQIVSLSGDNSRFKSDQFVAEAKKFIQFNEITGELLLQKDAMILITGNRRIEAQQIEILLTDGGDVSVIKALTTVKLTENSGRIALANEAYYEAESGEINLIESVQIIDGKNQLQGDKALINMETGYSKIFSGEKNTRVSGKLILGASN